MYGYALLWSLIPMTIALYVTEEMCARMGVVTGKGLSDLIREEFGFRPTFFVILAGLSWTWATSAPNLPAWPPPCRFSASPNTFPCRSPRWSSGFWCCGEPPARWKKYFWRPASSISPMSLPRFWPSRTGLLAARSTVIPTMHFNGGYLLMLTALIGTTIAPWQFFYLQAGFVEKRVSARQYPQARADVLVGSISCMVIVFFIIVCTAATLFATGHHDINDAGDAAQALVPLAGKWAAYALRFRPAERFAFRRFHFAAFHRARDLRRHGL